MGRWGRAELVRLHRCVLRMERGRDDRQEQGQGRVPHLHGTVDLYEELDEESGQEEAVAAEDVPFTVTFIPTGRPSRSTFTDSFRDPENGVSYRSRETVVHRTATVEGSLDGIDAVEGVVGTFSRRSMERGG